MAIIYLIKCDLDKESNGYVGQTSSKLKKRWSNHKISYKYFISGKTNLSYCTALYKAMREYGIENFNIINIEECDNSIVNTRETFWINEYNTISPYGYNNQSGGSSAWMQNNDTKIKITKGLLKMDITRTDVNKDLPRFITYFVRKDTTVHTHGYRVRYPTSGDSKSFMVPITKKLSDELLVSAKTYLTSIIDNHKLTFPEYYESESSSDQEIVPFNYITKSSGLPTYINNFISKNKMRHGYKVYYPPARKEKSFTTLIDNPLTESMLEDAKKHLKIIIDNYNNSILVNNLENLKIQKK